MKTGIIRRIDDLGRIVIPKEIRRNLGIREGDPLEIGVSDDAIVLTKYNVADECTPALDEIVTIMKQRYEHGSAEDVAHLNEAVEKIEELKEFLENY